MFVRPNIFPKNNGGISGESHFLKFRGKKGDLSFPKATVAYSEIPVFLPLKFDATQIDV
jgi:hypothetical protein